MKYTRTVQQVSSHVTVLITLTVAGYLLDSPRVHTYVPIHVCTTHMSI